MVVYTYIFRYIHKIEDMYMYIAIFSRYGESNKIKTMPVREMADS